MELYLDKVPDNQVWVVMLEEERWGREFTWFLTAELSSAVYQDESRFLAESRHQDPVTVSRWHVELPRRGMERDQVDGYVGQVLSEENHPAKRRLDISRAPQTERKP